MSDAEIRQYIERNKEEIAKILSPHMKTQIVRDMDSGKEHAVKEKSMIIDFTGTENTYSVSAKDKFSKPESVIVVLNADTTDAVVKGTMISSDKFKITSSAELSKVKIKVMLRGY